MITATTTAIAAAAFTPAWSRPEGGYYLQRPSVEQLIIRPDTVWFCGGDRSGWDVPSAFYFLRRTREWRRVAGGPAGPCVPHLRGAAAPSEDATRRAVGYQLTRIDSTSWGDSGRRIGRAFLRLTDDVYGRQTDLVPRVNPTKMRALMASYGTFADTDFAAVSAMAVSDSLLWIGLAGGFPEGEGAVGGIYRVERRTGRHELILDTLLDDHTVTSMASVGRWLWVGTARPAEFGSFGVSGLLRLDQRSREWRAYTAATSPLPGTLILAVQSDGHVLAVATELGLAVADLRDGQGASAPPAGGDLAISRWDVRYFVPAFVGDSLVFDPGTKAQHLRQVADEARYIFAQTYGRIGHERPLAEALARIAPDTLARQMESDDFAAIGAALGDSAFLRMLFAMDPSPGMLMAAGGVGAMGPRAPASAVDSVHRAFLALQSRESYERPAYRAALGRALALVGDSTSVRWARGELQRIVSSRAVGRGRQPASQDSVDESAAAADIVAAVRDRAGFGLLVSAIPVAEGKRAMVRALAAYDDPNAWRVLVAFAQAKQLPRGDALLALTPSALRDPRVADAVQDIIRDDLTHAYVGARWAILSAVRDLRLYSLAPDLVGTLDQRHEIVGDFLAESVIRTLVHLSGRADAPVYAESMPPRAVIEWWSRLMADHGGLPQATLEEGQRAEAMWSKRQIALHRDR